MHMSTIHLQSSVLCAYHGETFRAGRHFYQAYRYLRRSEEADADDIRKFRNRGMITLVNGSVPEEFRWLLKVIGLRGGIAEGLGYLEEYRTAVMGAERLEACLLLMLAGHTMDPGKMYWNEREDCGKGERTTLLYARALEDLGSGNSRGVVVSLLDYRQPVEERELPYLDLVLGEALLNSLDTTARQPLERFTGNNRGGHYRHYGWHKLSWCYALKGEWDLYRKSRQQVLDSGEPYLDADKQAFAEAGDTLPLNVELLKARLLFDGGYYREALGRLEDSSGLTLLNRRDSIDHRYRLARISDRLEDKNSAIASYEKVIASGPAGDWYFAPNAALHLGMIYEDDGNAEKAIEYYQLCLRINKSSYKRSIDHKARQGIERMEEFLKLR